eukprot:7391504-Prymnesium_polylepis.2
MRPKILEVRCGVGRVAAGHLENSCLHLVLAGAHELNHAALRRLRRRELLVEEVETHRARISDRVWERACEKTSGRDASRQLTHLKCRGLVRCDGIG